ncbi:hypothetical protein [Armatimonas rosea]|uniref:Uncharacterized protein n=1 Tax=Armatimonas rosea TaxID=685828 RepID=A0A7W9SX59_ARMRO|nr:hypothetical protein [Armatimonas rosea]MBB6053504.1 hypothetical protein [Armatimonas rosea]
MRLIGWVGLAFCSVGLLIDLATYHNISRVGGGGELADPLRTLFWGMVLFPIGANLSLVLLRRQLGR